MASNVQTRDALGDDSPDLERLHVELVKRLTVAEDMSESTATLLGVLRELTNAAAVLYFDALALQGKTPFASAHIEPCPVPLAKAAVQLAPEIRRAIQERRVQIASHEEFEGYSALVAPVSVVDGGTHLLIVFLLLADEPLESFVMVLQLIAGYFTLASQRFQGVQTAWEAEQTAAILELATRLTRARNLRAACFALVHDVQRHLNCKEVVLGVLRRGKWRIEAVSGRSEVDPRTDLGRDFELVMHEALLKGEATAWSAPSQRPVAESHRKLCQERRAQAIFSSTLDDDTEQSAWAWIVLSDQALPVASLRFLKAAGPVVVAGLRLLEAYGPRTSATAASAHRRRRAWWGVAALAVVCSMFLPVPFRVHSSATAQPVTHRFVAAPFEGLLASTSVRPGDTTQEGQVLAKLEDHELRAQLNEAMAQRASAEKRRDASLAKQEVAEAQLSRLETERLSLRIALLNRRLGQVEIRSPIAGQVISGDWVRSVGMPLRQGQTLFEIAPLDRMLVELEITDNDIHHIQVGKAVELWFESVPQPYTDVVLAVRPRAEIRDGANVFIAELELANQDQQLKPGLVGDARIEAGYRPLGWVLFRKPWYSIRQLLWW